MTIIRSHLNVAEATTNGDILACGDTVDVWHFGKRIALSNSTNEQFPAVLSRWPDVGPAVFRT